MEENTQITRCQYQRCKEALPENNSEFSLGLLHFCSANCQAKQLSFLRKVQKHIDSILETIEGCQTALVSRRRELCLMFREGEHRYNFFDKGFYVVNCTILSVDDIQGNVQIKYVHPKTGLTVVEPVPPEKLMWGKGADLNG